MRSWTILAALLLLPAASADVLVRSDGSGPLVLGLGVTDSDGAILAHQDLALDLDAPGVGFSSSTMHDHDAFFWMLTQPTEDGVLQATLSTAEGDSPYSAALALAQGGPSMQLRLQDKEARLTIGSDDTAFWRATSDGRLIAWGTLQTAEETAVFAAPRLDALKLEAWAMQGNLTSTAEVQFGSRPPSSDPVGDLLGLAPLPEDPEEVPAACTDLRQEPPGDWYTDTHVRISVDPASRLTATDWLGVTYRLRDEEGVYMAAHVVDPFGHVVLRAPDAGAYTLAVEQGDTTCTVPVTVQPSQGATGADFQVEGGEGTMHVSFQAESEAHYDVDAIVTDTASHRVVYAGKIHSHGGTTSAEFRLPPGQYAVDLYPVAQGPGPTVDRILHDEVIVTAPAPEAAPAPAVAPVAFLALLGLAASRRR